ncbi:SPFH domain-containing protein [Streptomyces sp. Da 82-17]|uniref:SPFH domain-containing protein n=1 Tax=Streptomyces sp. Da 82-17 TaxID=3377116 RepID=UPI0038D476E2
MAGAGVDAVIRIADDALRREAAAPAPASRPVPVGRVPGRAVEGPDEFRGGVASGWLAVLVVVVALAGGAFVAVATELVPEGLLDRLALPRFERFDRGPWGPAALAGCVLVAVVTAAGIGRGAVGSAWVLRSFGRYRGTVRRTGLVWISPFVLRRRVDVRLKHWRSEPMPAVDAEGNRLSVVVLVVWRVADTARAVFAVDDSTSYLREQVEAALARVLSQRPADAYEQRDGRSTLRDAEAVGGALTALLREECRAAGIEVYSAQPTRIEYAPDVAAAMHRRQVAALDARHRDGVLSAVVDSVEDTVVRLTARGLVELDDFERKALVKDLTIAFYSARAERGERADAV